MATQTQHLYTFEEYLELEEKAEYKSEFHAGEIYAMSGGTLPHSALSVRAAAMLFTRLPECGVYGSDLKLFITQANRCVYPDCMVICGEPQFWKKREDVVVNPILVVEVLSPSTELYDQGDKANYYRSIPSVEHILLISQERMLMEHFARQENGTWIITPYMNREDAIPLMGVTLPVRELYGNVP